MRFLNSWTASPRRLSVSAIILSDSSNILFCFNKDQHSTSTLDDGPYVRDRGVDLTGNSLRWRKATYPVFDVPFIGIVGDEFVHLQFLILIFLCVQLSFLCKPLCVDPPRDIKRERRRDRSKRGDFEEFPPVREPRGYPQTKGKGYKGETRTDESQQKIQNEKKTI